MNIIQNRDSKKVKRRGKKGSKSTSRRIDEEIVELHINLDGQKGKKEKVRKNKKSLLNSMSIDQRSNSSNMNFL